MLVKIESKLGQKYSDLMKIDPTGIQLKQSFQNSFLFVKKLLQAVLTNFSWLSEKKMCKFTSKVALEWVTISENL